MYTEGQKPQLMIASIIDGKALRQTLSHIPEGQIVPQDAVNGRFHLGWAVAHSANLVYNATESSIWANAVQATGANCMMGAGVEERLANFATAMEMADKTQEEVVSLSPAVRLPHKILQALIEIPNNRGHYLQTLEVVPFDDEAVRLAGKCSVSTAFVWLYKAYSPFKESPVGRKIQEAALQEGGVKYEKLSPGILNLVVATAGYLSSNPQLIK